MVNQNTETTLVLIKPDALLNSLTGYMLSTLSEFHTGLRFAAAKVVCVHRELAEEHYAEHRGKLFYEALLDYIMGCAHYPDAPEKRRIVALVLRGVDAIQKIRRIAGPTNPHDARREMPGTIRALGTVVPIRDEDGNEISQRIDNLIHASANVSDAEREIKLWFKPTDIPPRKRGYPTEECDVHYYIKAGELLPSHEPGAVCLLAPGDQAWRSDLETLRSVSDGSADPAALGVVVAKYMMNV